MRLNTDAIDNSAGVNTSDVEVNIKIALSLPVRDGRLTLKTRNTLLGKMTDEVAALVLRNNYLQTLALSLAQRRGLEDLGFQQRLMQTLGAEAASSTARSSSCPTTWSSPSASAAAAADAAGAVGAARLRQALALRRSARIRTCRTIPIWAASSAAISPRLIAQKFPDALEKHRLRREIISTQLANSMINRGGPSLVVRIADQTGAAPAAIAFAFAAVRDSYDMPARNEEINALDGKIAGKVQLSLYAAVQDLLLDRVVWFLRNADLTQGPGRRGRALPQGHRRAERARSTRRCRRTPRRRGRRAARSLIDAGVPEALARRIADIPEIAAAPDMVLIADRTKKPIAAIVATYFAAEAYFRVDRVVAAARGIVVSDYFDRLALDRALDSIGDAERRLDRGDGRDRRDRRGRGRGLGQAAPGRGRAHPRGDPPDRGQRADAVEADGGGEPAGRSGEGVKRALRRSDGSGRIRRSRSPGGEGSVSMPRRLAQNSMPEMPRAGEHHGDVVLVGGGDHLVVVHRAAGLDHRGGAGLDRDQQAVGEREERVGGDHRALGQRRRRASAPSRRPRPCARRCAPHRRGSSGRRRCRRWRGPWHRRWCST